MASVTLQVNGAASTFELTDPDTPLLYVLRNDLALTGTKFGCGLGQCGACTVQVDGQAVRSCSMPVSAVVGRQITTIEGLGSPEKPDPAIVEFTPDEMYLVEGIERGVSDCEPVRDKLPKDAVAGIECLGKDWFVARVGYYLFENDEQMLDHYFARMEAEGVTRDTGSCFDGEGEGAYIPGPEEVASRQGCFITAEGVANYRLTLPGAHVYIGIVGHNIDTVELQDFAFLGNRDTPSSPTLWGNPNS